MLGGMQTIKANQIQVCLMMSNSFDERTMVTKLMLGPAVPMVTPAHHQYVTALDSGVDTDGCCAPVDNNMDYLYTNWSGALKPATTSCRQWMVSPQLASEVYNEMHFRDSCCHVDTLMPSFPHLPLADGNDDREDAN